MSDSPGQMDEADVLILPGVGAFPSAMDALRELGLVEYLRAQAKNHRPIIGICLGMHLLASASHEYQYTEGLGIIPGDVKPLSEPKWHIGWNVVENIQVDPLLSLINNRSFYFNHSYTFSGDLKYQFSISRHKQVIPAIIRNGNTVGLQFHPEKSQTAGSRLLQNLISGLGHA